MKALLLIPFLLVTVTSFSQHTVTGKWKTIDDNTGKERSIIELYEEGDKVAGRIVKLFRAPGEDPDPVCDECEEDDSRYMKKIIGMVILKNLKKDGTEYSGGEILDPEDGKVYRCKVWLDGGNLKVRGYWGPFFRTQTWEREP